MTARLFYLALIVASLAMIWTSTVHVMAYMASTV